MAGQSLQASYNKKICDASKLRCMSVAVYWNVRSTAQFSKRHPVLLQVLYGIGKQWVALKVMGF